VSHNWKNILIPPSATIAQAICVIDKEALRVALIVDGKEQLLGIVTDGDIRRAIIRHVPLTDPVKHIMNSLPLVADVTTPRETLLEMMKEKSLLSIPLLENGVLVGLETLHHIIQRPVYENPVFLMAGGFGTRLKPLTDTCPKPMLKVGGKPILATILENFINAGFVNFFISTHYMAEQIREHFGNGRRWNVNIHYVHEVAPLGTGGALGLLPDDRPDLPVLVMNGDVLTKVDFQRLLAFHNEHRAAATMCVREYEYQIPFGVVEGRGERIVSVVEKPVQRQFVNAGIYVISQQVVDSVAANQVIDMPTLLNEQIEQGYEVFMFPVYEYWMDVGHVDDLQRAQSDIVCGELGNAG
jgi:dTDP-glucose pyrophosphorylase